MAIRSDVESRLWKKTDRSAGPLKCWTWLGSTDSHGYGSIYQDGRLRRATHVAWEIANRAAFPAGKLACHRCDTPACVNPAHLFVGSHAENTRDMMAKGRQRMGHLQAAKTHCPHGHVYPDKTNKYGRRVCLPCQAARARNRRAAARSECRA